MLGGVQQNALLLVAARVLNTVDVYQFWNNSVSILEQFCANSSLIALREHNGRFMRTLSTCIRGVSPYSSVTPKAAQSLWCAICTYIQSAHALVQKPLDKIFRCGDLSNLFSPSYSLLFFFQVILSRKVCVATSVYSVCPVTGYCLPRSTGLVKSVSLLQICTPTYQKDCPWAEQCRVLCAVVLYYRYRGHCTE